MNAIFGNLDWTSVALLAVGIAAVILRARRQDMHPSPPTTFEDSEHLSPAPDSFQSRRSSV